MNKVLKFFGVFVLTLILCLVTSCKRGKDDDKDDDKNDDNNTPKVTYNVTYNADGGQFSDGLGNKILTYDENSKVDILSDVPSKEGFDFLGWFDISNDQQVVGSFYISKDVTLIAKWGTPTLKVTYDAGTGTFSDGSGKRVINVEVNSSFQYIEVPTNDNGRLFNGWYNDETDELVEEGFIITTDMKVKAKYSRPGELRDLTYVLNGGTMENPSNDSYYEGIMYKLSTPTKAGFEFEGWFSNSDFTGTAVKVQGVDVEGDVTYYAKWKLVDKNYVDALIDELIPSELTNDIDLPTSYQGVSLYWTSGDYTLLKADTRAKKGIIYPTHRNQKVSLKCQVTVDNEYIDITREVTIKAIQFEHVDNPVAGYFYHTDIKNQTESFTRTFDIVYIAFACVTAGGDVVVDAGAKTLLSKTNELRKQGIRCVLSIAGGAENFSQACYANTVKVADNLVKLVKEYNLDGIDVDWEYPNTALDTSNFVDLVKFLREKLDALSGEDGTPYLVTAAIPGTDKFRNFNFAKSNQYLDYVNLMSYDMNLEGRTTHLCPLSRGGDGGMWNVEWSVRDFVAGGLDKHKIIIGAAFYGKTYKVTGAVDLSSTYPGLFTAAELVQMQYQSGTVTYKYIYENFLKNPDYTRYWDRGAKVPYLYNDKEKIFVTYEDEESLIAKVEYAYQEGLGIMFWDYSYDKDNILTDTICDRMYELRNNIELE